jgi:hypothetical protein
MTPGTVQSTRPDGADATETRWIDELADEQCMEIFWLYVDPPEPFLAAHSPALLGRAMRYALHRVAEAREAPGGP